MIPRLKVKVDIPRCLDFYGFQLLQIALVDGGIHEIRTDLAEYFSALVHALPLFTAQKIDKGVAFAADKNV